MMIAIQIVQGGQQWIFKKETFMCVCVCHDGQRQPDITYANEMPLSWNILGRLLHFTYVYRF